MSIERQLVGTTRRGPGKPRYPMWLAVPALIWYVALFIVPLSFVAVFSVSKREGFSQVVYDFNLRNYRDLLDPIFVDVFVRTMGLALVGTAATLVIGLPFAYYIVRYSQHKALLLLLVIVPFWTSFLIRTYAWLVLLDPDFPAIRVLRYVGILPSDVQLLYTPTAVYIGVVYTYLPLMILPLYAALERVDFRLVDAAQDLGDRPLRAFRKITLPLALPGIVAGSILVFVPIMGEYLNPVLLGGDKTLYMGNLIGQQFLVARDWPLGSALALTVIACLTITVAVIGLSTASRERANG